MAVFSKKMHLLPKSVSGKQTIIGYLFISPFILGFLFWFLVPALTSIWLSLQNWNIIQPPKFVWFDNFRTLWNDNLFWQSLKVTTIFTLFSVPIGLTISFLIALLLNTKVVGLSVFRTLYYLPSIVPAVANAVLWAWILNSEFGLLNGLLNLVGIPKVLWLADPAYALPALIVMSFWSAIGGTMVIFIAGLQGVPDVYYEAAEMDGANAWTRLIYITIPQMSPVIFFNLVLGIIGSFQVFTAGYLMTSGGPQNATLFYVLYLYNNGFKFFKMGYASALAWVLFIIIMALTMLVFKYFGSMVYYEDNP